MATGQLLYDPYPRPLSTTGLTLPGAYYNFYYSGTTTPAPVYQGAITGAGGTPYPAILLPFLSTTALYNAVVADGTGTFLPIFLAPTIVYRVQLYTSTGVLIEDVDPYVPQMPSVGNGQVIIDAQGEVTLAAPIAGGTGITLTVYPRAGAQALELVGTTVGAPTLIINNSVLVGTQTATFAASNKPGTGTTAPSKWLPIQCDGGTYYIPLWQ
jgi:hypothetical protein